MSENQAPEPFPGHDPGAFAPVPCQTVATWAVGHFAENLAVAADGAVFVSLHSHSRIDRYDPATREVRAWATRPAGVVIDVDGGLHLTCDARHCRGHLPYRCRCESATNTQGPPTQTARRQTLPQ
jgi:streptogramin lyase